MFSKQGENVFGGRTTVALHAVNVGLVRHAAVMFLTVPGGFVVPSCDEKTQFVLAAVQPK